MELEGAFLSTFFIFEPIRAISMILICGGGFSSTLIRKTIKRGRFQVSLFYLAHYKVTRP